MLPASYCWRDGCPFWAVTDGDPVEMFDDPEYGPVWVVERVCLRHAPWGRWTRTAFARIRFLTRGTP